MTMSVSVRVAVVVVVVVMLVGNLLGVVVLSGGGHLVMVGVVGGLLGGMLLLVGHCCGRRMRVGRMVVLLVLQVLLRGRHTRAELAALLQVLLVLVGLKLGIGRPLLLGRRARIGLRPISGPTSAARVAKWRRGRAGRLRSTGAARLLASGARLLSSLASCSQPIGRVVGELG